MAPTRSTSYRLVTLQILILLFLCSLSHLAGFFSNSFQYTPFSVGEKISPQTFDESNIYAPVAARFMKSGLLMGDLDVYERSRQGHTFPPFPALVIGSFGYLFGSIEAAWMSFKVLCPILIWLLIYLAMSRVSSNVWLRSLIAWAVVLISFGPRNALLIGAYAMYQPLDVTRLPQPAMSFVVLLLAIHLSAWALETRSLLALGFAGVVGSVLFYTYYYYWICFFGGLSILMLVFIGLKRWRQSRDTFVILF